MQKELAGSTPGDLESPFLEDELFSEEAAPSPYPRLELLRSESPFASAFRRKLTRPS